LSREKTDIPAADAVRHAEGHMKGRAIKDARIISAMRADRDLAW
jgi:hypothetical protein